MHTSAFVFALAFGVATVLAMDLPKVHLCDQVLGFASQVNDHFQLQVDTTLRTGESLVLVVRPSPYDPTLSFAQALINASFMHEGATVRVLSNNGILQIADQLEQDTIIDVQIQNERPSGQMPFVFYSYQAGFPSCSIGFDAQHPFTGAIPTTILNSRGRRAPLYLKVRAPQNVNGFKVDAASSFGSVPMYFGEAPASSGDTAGTELRSGDAQSWSRAGENLYLTILPPASSTNDPTAAIMVHVSVSWFTLAPRPPAPTPTTGARVPTPAAPSNGGSPSSATVAKEASGGFFGAFFVILLVYFAGRTVYNYRVQGITNFPEYVPHHEAFAAAGRFVSAFVTHMRTQGRHGLFQPGGGGYTDVNRDEVYSGH